MNPPQVRLITIYSLLWIVFVTSTFVLYPTLNISCVIPVVLIVGIGAWIFGTMVGLCVTLLSLIHNFILTGIVYADDIEFYQYTLNGYILLPTISYLIGHLRLNLKALKETNRRLDKMVEGRTLELDSLTSKLLENSEHLKNSRGQNLHDGIGQQLTGIQLLSSAISEQLIAEKNPTVALADTILRKSSGIHLQIRRISRLLFPIKIGELNLMTALCELAAAIEDIKSVNIDISCPHIFQPLPSDIKIQLYRICQEDVLFIIEHEQPQKISINLSIKQKQRRIRICRKQTVRRILKVRPLLTNYRLQKVSGSHREFIHNGKTFTEYMFPYTEA